MTIEELSNELVEGLRGGIFQADGRLFDGDFSLRELSSVVPGEEGDAYLDFARATTEGGEGGAL